MSGAFGNMNEISDINEGTHGSGDLKAAMLKKAPETARHRNIESLMNIAEATDDELALQLLESAPYTTRQLVK